MGVLQNSVNQLLTIGAVAADRYNAGRGEDLQRAIVEHNSIADAAEGFSGKGSGGNFTRINTDSLAATTPNNIIGREKSISTLKKADEENKKYIKEAPKNIMKKVKEQQKSNVAPVGLANDPNASIGDAGESERPISVSHNFGSNTFDPRNNAQRVLQNRANIGNERAAQQIRDMLTQRNTFELFKQGGKANG